MNEKSVYKLLTFSIATIWIVNGLFCKVLNLVPRHQQIVAKILGNEHAQLFTIIIGISEIFMAIWILSNVKSGFNAIVQILLIATMNTVEFILVPDMLLWGKANAIFALILILVIFLNEFYLNRKSAQQT
ncbi:MAG: DoxX-like family protein [Chitinophagaceae bacterium]|nr:DoxX-like family protein [Chitinophagaceae bacterium]